MKPESVTTHMKALDIHVVAEQSSFCVCANLTICLICTEKHGCERIKHLNPVIQQVVGLDSRLAYKLSPVSDVCLLSVVCTTDSLMQALVSGSDGYEVVSQMLLIFLQILLQGQSTKQAKVCRDGLQRNLKPDLFLM